MINNKRQEDARKNPGAAIIIYNYKHRLGDAALSTKEDTEEVHAIDQIVLNTASLMKVTTSKTKSQPTGTFEITLAPTKNWVNTITPGSWCVILMSQEKINAEDTKWNEPKAKLNKVKMLGRIDSVRSVSSVNQSTGAISSKYIIQGEDWCGILNSKLYVDPIMRGNSNFEPFGTAERLLYDKLLADYGKFGLPTSTENIKILLSFWGRTSSDVKENYTNKSREEVRQSIEKINVKLDRLSESKNNFRIPNQIKDFFDFKSLYIADILNVIAGKIVKKDLDPTDKKNNALDVYEEIDDGSSPMAITALLGINNFWQLIIQNSNNWINDTYAEMRWDYDVDAKDVRPKLAIYNRVKPFAINSIDEIVANAATGANSTPSSPNIKDFVSEFKNIRVHNVPRSDILLINVGTNWRDRFNFIEVRIKSGLKGGTGGNDIYSPEIKLKSQTFEKNTIGRDGFKPLIINAQYIPKNKKTNIIDPFRILEYKSINREWHFQTHRMFNGSIDLIGQSNYIAVGDNIRLDADAVFPGKNGNIDHITNKNKTYFLAHIESVSHTCSVAQNGARTFITSIQFVRGIITDENGKMIDKDRLLDEDVSKVTPTQELNSNRVFGTSSGKNGNMDPDNQKLKGN